jgi:hypothetical protein
LNSIRTAMLETRRNPSSSEKLIDVWLSKEWRVRYHTFTCFQTCWRLDARCRKDWCLSMTSCRVWEWAHGHISLLLHMLCCSALERVLHFSFKCMYESGCVWDYFWRGKASGMCCQFEGCSP